MDRQEPLETGTEGNAILDLDFFQSAASSLIKSEYAKYYMYIQTYLHFSETKASDAAHVCLATL